MFVTRFSRVFISRSFLLICLLYAVGDRLYAWWTDDDLQGDANFWCIREELPAVKHGTDMVVTAHRTDCDTLGKDSMTYVYLHHLSTKDRPVNQIFRYDGDDPEIVWKDPKHLLIHVDKISEIGKQVSNLGGIHIDYEMSLTPEDFDRAYERTLRRLANPTEHVAP